MGSAVRILSVWGIPISVHASWLAVPRERWAATRVREMMRPVNEALVIRPDEDLLRALERATQNQLGRLAVVDRGRLVGDLSLKDITHVLVLRGLAGAEAGPERLAAAGVFRRAA